MLFEKAFDDKWEAFEMAVSTGIKDYADNVTIDEETAIAVCLYDYVYHSDKVPMSIVKQFKKLSTNGFPFDESTYREYFYDPEGNFHLEYMSGIDGINNLKMTEIYEYAQLKTVSNRIRITPGASVKRVSASGTEPMAMINVATLFNFRDCFKSEFNIATLCVYAAIKSTIGKDKKYVKSNKEFILNRAFPTNAAMRDKYSTRRRWEYLIKELESNWGVIYYANHTRGFYISLGKLNLLELAKVAEKSKVKNQVDELKAKKEEAKRKALEEIRLENLMISHSRRSQKYE